jgi:hypothetical protein
MRIFRITLSKFTAAAADTSTAGDELDLANLSDDINDIPLTGETIRISHTRISAHETGLLLCMADGGLFLYSAHDTTTNSPMPDDPLIRSVFDARHLDRQFL